MLEWEEVTSSSRMAVGARLRLSIVELGEGGRGSVEVI